MTAAVLDASAVLALLYRESGHERVAELLSEAVVSAVNWAEVVQKLFQRGHTAPLAAARGVESLGVQVMPFTRTAAVRAGILWPTTRSAGLSLGDRACLATALEFERVAVTADRAWVGLGLDVKVELIR